MNAHRKLRRSAMTLIELLVCLSVIVTLSALLLPAVAQARATAHRIACTNNLKQIGLALHLRHDSRKALPAGRGSPAPKIFSPQAAILPYIEQAAAYGRIDFEAAPADYSAGTVLYDGSRNFAIASKTLPLFNCPAAGSSGRVDGSPYGGTHYVACTGSGRDAGTLKDADGLFFTGSSIRFADVTDGTTYTAAFSERPFGAGANRNSIDVGNPHLVMREIPGNNDPLATNCSAAAAGNWNHERGAKWIVGNYGNTLYNHALTPNSAEWDCLNMTQQKARMAARSQHQGGVNMLFSDGRVSFVTNSVSFTIWQAMATRSGADIVADVP